MEKLHKCKRFLGKGRLKNMRVTLARGMLLVSCLHRRRIKTEEKAKVVSAAHKMNCTKMI